MGFCIIYTTTSNIDESKKIAYHLVESKLAACVNIVPKVISVYSWQDKINEDEEYLLVIKTQKNRFEDVKKAILELHSYELPEIVMLPIKKGHKEYLSWIKKESTKVKKKN